MAIPSSIILFWSQQTETKLTCNADSLYDAELHSRGTAIRLSPTRSYDERETAYTVEIRLAVKRELYEMFVSARRFPQPDLTVTPRSDRRALYPAEAKGHHGHVPHHRPSRNILLRR
jgi:hypothetical protein